MATEAAKAIEAILMVAQEPVDPHLLAQLLEVSPDRVSELCRELQAAYERDDRGFVLVKVAGGYRFQSHGDMAPYVERFVLEGQTARLSAAALETLAIVAYKQPISRAQVAAIRGVNVDGVMRTLQQRGYIDEVGRDPGPGQATLFGTTTEFLERLGLDSIHDLPAIADLFPDASVLEALEHGLRVESSSHLEKSSDQSPSDQSPSDQSPSDRSPSDQSSEPVDGPGPDAEVGAPFDAPADTTIDGAGDDVVGGGVEPELPTWFTELDPVDDQLDPVDDEPATAPSSSATVMGEEDDVDGEEQSPDGSV